MNFSLRTLQLSCRTIMGAFLLFALPAVAETAPAVEPEVEGGGRAVAMQIEAEVTAIDLKTREVSLRGPDGFVLTMTAPEKVVKLEDVAVGDKVSGTFFAALEGEIRSPTEEEQATPWLEVEGEEVSTDVDHPAIEMARVIRAVVTVEGISQENSVVAVKDSRGRVHFIGDVEPEKMAKLKVGETVVMVFTQAVALSLEKASPKQ